MRRTRPAPAFLCILAVWCGCARQKEKEIEPVIPVQVTEARRDSIRRFVTAEGILHPRDQAGIMPKIAAPVKRFLVNRGDRVAAGQVVALLDNSDLTAAVADAKGAYEQAAAAFRNTSAASVPDEIVRAQQEAQAAAQALEASRKVLESRRQLFQDGALARRLVDEASVAYAQANSASEIARNHLESLEKIGRQEEVKSAQGGYDSAKGKYDAARAQLSYSEIRSPIAGVVADRPLYAGEMAGPGSPLLTVMDVSRVIARASIPAAQAAYLKVGNPASIRPTEGGEEVAGKVTVVSPAVDPQSTTVEIWVESANPGERLRPGASVQVSILAETIRDAIVVPPEALLSSPSGGTAVMVIAAGMAHEMKVEVGARESGKVQISSGVRAGDKVVVQGAAGLEDGAKVRIVKPGEAEEQKDGKAGKE